MGSLRPGQDGFGEHFLLFLSLSLARFGLGWSGCWMDGYDGDGGGTRCALDLRLLAGR